jgi:hypothetical protein
LWRTGQRRRALHHGFVWRRRQLPLARRQPALRNVGLRQALELARNLVETSMKLVEFFAIAQNFAALRRRGRFVGIVRVRDVEGALGLATRFVLANAPGFPRFVPRAFNFAPGFVAGALDFVRFVALTFGFAAGLFAQALGFTRLLAGARGLSDPPGAFGFVRRLGLALTVMLARAFAALPLVAARLVAIRGACPANRLVFAQAAPAALHVARAIALPLITARVRAPVLGRAIKLGGSPRFLILFIGSADDTVEPIADRDIGGTHGLTRSAARFRTETPEIPRTAGSHSREPTS